MTDFTFCLRIEFKISLPTQGEFEVHPRKILRFNFVKLLHKFTQMFNFIFQFNHILPFFVISHRETIHFAWLSYIIFNRNWSNAIHSFHRNAIVNFRISSRQLSHAGLIFIGSPTSQFGIISFLYSFRRKKNFGNDSMTPINSVFPILI